MATSKDLMSRGMESKDTGSSTRSNRLLEPEDPQSTDRRPRTRNRIQPERPIARPAGPGFLAARRRTQWLQVKPFRSVGHAWRAGPHESRREAVAVHECRFPSRQTT